MKQRNLEDTGPSNPEQGETGRKAGGAAGTAEGVGAAWTSRRSHPSRLPAFPPYFLTLATRISSGFPGSVWQAQSRMRKL
jgi:hypothetical protein